MPVDTSTAPPDATEPQQAPPIAPNGDPSLPNPAEPVLPPATPEEQALVDQMQRLQVVDLSFEQEQLGIQYAEQKLAAKFTDAGGRVRKTIKAMWYNNFAREWYIDSYRREFARRIDSNADDLYAELGVSKDASRAAVAATVQRLTDNEFLYKHAGEKQEELHRQDEEPSDVEVEIKSSLKQLILERIGATDDGHKLDDEAFRDRQHELLKGLKDAMPHLFEGANLLATNLNRLVVSAEALASHTDGLERAKAVLDNIQIRVAHARPGLSTEAYQTATGRIANKLHTRKWLNGTTIGVALLGVTIAANTARSVTVSAAKVAGGLGVGAGVAGTLAALRERYIVNREAHVARREFASGNELEGRGRLAEYKAAQYNTISAQDSIASMRQLIELAEAGSLDDEKAREALDITTEVRERLYMGDVGNIDLIRYSSLASDPERWQLVQKIAELRAKVAERYVGIEKPIKFTVNEETGEVCELSIDEYLRTKHETVADKLSTEQEATDKAFKTLRRKRMGTAFKVAATTSLVIGGSMLLGHAIEGAIANTDVATAGVDAIETHTETFGSTHVELPQGVTAVQNGDTIVLHGGIDSHEIGVVQLDANGVPTPESLDALQSTGLTIDDVSTKLVDVPSGVSIDDYLSQHADHLTSVHTVGWAEGPNELQLHSGGVEGGWLDQQGNVVIDVSGMHGGPTPDVVSITATGTHQGAAEVFPVVDGHVTIPPGQLSHDLFTNNEFHGGVMQVGHIEGGSVESGNVEVVSLAAFRGTDTAQLMGSVSHAEVTVTVGVQPDAITDITGQAPPETTGAGTGFVPFVPLPLYARRGLGDFSAPPRQSAPDTSQNPTAPTTSPNTTTTTSAPSQPPTPDTVAIPPTPAPAEAGEVPQPFTWGSAYRNDSRGLTVRITGEDADNVTYVIDIDNGPSSETRTVARQVAQEMLVVGGYELLEASTNPPTTPQQAAATAATPTTAGDTSGTSTRNTPEQVLIAHGLTQFYVEPATNRVWEVATADDTNVTLTRRMGKSDTVTRTIPISQLQTPDYAMSVAPRTLRALQELGFGPIYYDRSGSAWTAGVIVNKDNPDKPQKIILRRVGADRSQRENRTVLSTDALKDRIARGYLSETPSNSAQPPVSQPTDPVQATQPVPSDSGTATSPPTSSESALDTQSVSSTEDDDGSRQLPQYYYEKNGKRRDVVYIPGTGMATITDPDTNQSQTVPPEQIFERLKNGEITTEPPQQPVVDDSDGMLEPPDGGARGARSRR